MTLYQHFAAKSDLVLELLRQREEQAGASLSGFVDRYTLPLDRIKAVFSWHEAWFSEETFSGCMFINAATEFPDHTDAMHRTTAAQKQHVTELLRRLLGELFDETAAARLAAQFLILIDGVTVTAQISGDPQAAMVAWDIAQQLMEGVLGRTVRAA